MTSRFELTLDTAGKFHFHLRGPDGSALLDSHAFDSKIMAQNAVLHARTALKDEARLVQERGSDGKHRLAVKDNDGTVLARSPVIASPSALQPLIEAVRTVGQTAPIVDLTKRRTANTST